VTLQRFRSRRKRKEAGENPLLLCLIAAILQRRLRLPKATEKTEGHPLHRIVGIRDSHARTRAHNTRRLRSYYNSRFRTSYISLLIPQRI